MEPILRWLMPVVAMVLAYESVTQPDIIAGVTAFGILRSWWLDVLDSDNAPIGKILGRVLRWVILGLLLVQFWRARKCEEYVVCVLVAIVLWLWRQGKLSGFYKRMKCARLLDFSDISCAQQKSAVVVCRAGPKGPRLEHDDSFDREILECARHEYEAFLISVSELKEEHRELVTRFAKTKEHVDGGG